MREGWIERHGSKHKQGKIKMPTHRNYTQVKKNTHVQPGDANVLNAQLAQVKTAAVNPSQEAFITPA